MDKKLGLKKEVVEELVSSDLDQVQGGAEQDGRRSAYGVLCVGQAGEQITCNEGAKITCNEGAKITCNEGDQVTMVTMGGRK